MDGITQNSGNHVAEIRKAKGLTQQGLAELLGVHTITVSKLERGKMQLTTNWINRIAKALDVPSGTIWNPASFEENVPLYGGMTSPTYIERSYLARELQFEFEDIQIPVGGKNCLGVLASGHAVLEGSDDGFTVRKIRMNGGTWLRRSGNLDFGRPDRLADELFKSISQAIENPKTAVGRSASREWAEQFAVEEHSSTEAA